MLVSVSARELLSYERFQFAILRTRGALFYAPQIADARSWDREIARQMATARPYRREEHEDVPAMGEGHWE
jgi:hypothetical protein